MEVHVAGPKLCVCGLPAKIVTSWTDKNPGRKFYGCPRFKVGGQLHCNFFGWVDEEEVTGWPRTTLIEARDEIRRLKKTISELRKELENEKIVSLANDVTKNLNLKEKSS